MKSAKAIELLSDSANYGITTFNQDFKQATRLGIEALIRHKNRNILTFAGMLEPLQGETEE